MSYVHLKEKEEQNEPFVRTHLRNLKDSEFVSLVQKEYETLTPIGKELANRFLGIRKFY